MDNNTNTLPTNIKSIIDSTDQVIYQFESSQKLISDSVDKITNTILIAKNIDYSIKLLDAQVELMCKEMDIRIEKHKINAQIVQNQLTHYSKTMDNLLIEILKLDNSNNDVNYIKSRSELISVLRSISDNVSNIFIHFITI